MAIVFRQNSLEKPASSVLQQNDQHLRTIRPIGAYQLHGIAVARPEHLVGLGASDRSRKNSAEIVSPTATPETSFTLIAIDAVRGYLLQIDRETDNTTILNPYQVDDFLDASGLALETNETSTTLWFCRENSVYFCDLANLTPQQFVRLSYPANGVAVWESTVYITCQKAGYILVFDRDTGRQLDKFYTPGVGIENLTIREDELWVCDRTEQSVYCLDRTTGEVRFRLLTPFERPTGLAFGPAPETGQEMLYVSYATEESYIRDNPNSLDNPLEIAVRDRTFIHPLHFRVCEAERYALANGYLLEMSYVEELSPLDAVQLENLEWRIALPSETPRQTVKHIEPIGLPFSEEIQDDQRVAVFRFETLKSNEARLFGWKALIEVRGIKYLLTPGEVEDAPDLSSELKDRYLVDDDELMMDSEIVRRAAREAVGSETNLLRKILKIRDYVYDRLSYGIQPRIDTPDIVLRRGVGSCGEYVGVLLALARLNGIACRTVGRYKCPPQADQHFVPLQPDFNHVWLEFYIPGYGWVPIESNPDDVIERGPYPTRFFMGLPWNHIELGKGIRFETTNFRQQGIRLGELALNHVRFTILGELAAP